MANWPGGCATGPLDVLMISLLKGEISKDITSTASNHADSTTTCYYPEGVVCHVLEAMDAFTTNVGDGVN